MRIDNFGANRPGVGPPPSSAPAGPAADRKNRAVAGRSVAGTERLEPNRGVLPRSSPPPGGGPAAGAPASLKSHCEPRRRRRFPEEVMGEEHGMAYLFAAR